MTISPVLRPREKIQQRSIRALSDHELVQAVIGSGSGHYSVKRLARSVLKLASRKQVVYEDLLQIAGLGTAKAARLAASFELARRYSPESFDVIKLIDGLLASGVGSYTNVAMVSMDGAKRIVRSELVPIADILDTSAIQTLCRRLVLDNAVFVTIGLEAMQQSVAAEFCRLAYRAFRTIGVTLLEFRCGGSIYAEQAK